MKNELVLLYFCTHVGANVGESWEWFQESSRTDVGSGVIHLMSKFTVN